MTKTHFEPSIRSRPVYGELKPKPGSGYLFVADGEGAKAILELFDNAGPSAKSLLAKSHIIYMPGPNGDDLSTSLEALGATQYHRSPNFACAQPRLKKVLSDAHMGLQIYLAQFLQTTYR